MNIGGDLDVTRIGYGAMRLADSAIWRGPADRQGALSVLRRAVELGVNFVDTFDAYSLGANEELIAEALHPYADDLVIATKAGVTRPTPEAWVPLGRPEYLKQQAELSLRRLRLDTIDLFYLHRVDPQVPLADQIGALAELRQEGKIRHIGLSEVSVGQLAEATAIAPVAAVQNMYNLATREHEDVVDYAEKEGIAFVPFFPIATGDHARPDSPLAAIASAAGATPAQVALAWLLRRSSTMVPIPGTSSITHLEENVEALRVTLTDAQYDELSTLA